MSIETKMDYLVETKNEIKQAIRDQGVDVSDALPFRQYAAKVGNIVTSVDGVGVHEFKRGEQMLENAYWVGRIVNQRGQNTYTKKDSTCAIDRWSVYSGHSNSNVKLSPLDTCLRLVISSNDPSKPVEFYQRFIPKDMGLKGGDTVTFSILFKAYDYFTEAAHEAFMFMWSADNSISINSAVYIDYTDDSTRLASYTITLPNGFNLDQVCGVTFNQSVIRSSVNFYAAKLEKGSVQTLAHQENGVWILNDPAPDPALELLKCQRYLRVYSDDTPLGTCIRGGFGSYGTVLSGPPMRCEPTIIQNGALIQFGYSSGVHVTKNISQFGKSNQSPIGDISIVTTETSGIGDVPDAGDTLLIVAKDSPWLILSAEL